MKTSYVFTILIITTLISIVFGWYAHGKLTLSKPEVLSTAPRPRPQDKYTIENLAKTDVKPAQIVIEKVIKQNSNFSSYLFSFSFDPTLDNKQNKKVTGILNIPNTEDTYPLILMIRGYVNQSSYQTGMGTSRAGDYFAKNGFITVAPDFLGYGGSDPEAGNIFETRFQTYTTILSLLKSLESLPQTSNLISGPNEVTTKLTNHKAIFLWAHSNGGQIALTTLEITGKPYPTVLWAPVSTPFPYSVLYYTDESDDGGKLIRRELAKFEADYDTDLYSLSKYLGRIKAPIAIHQGTADNAVPVSWTKSLCSNLTNLDLNPDCNYYSGADHNLMPSWNQVVEKNVLFFFSKL